jgi:dihydroorotate dehydrogenase
MPGKDCEPSSSAGRGASRGADRLLYALARPLLFRLDGERSHDLSLHALDRARALGLARAPQPLPGRTVRAMGLEFANPVGLAAGLDKNGAFVDALASFGFGFIEVGTVTPRPQPGNPRPRLFRLPKARAVINRFGFNNLGVDALVANVAERRYRGVLGINIGKNFDTPMERAAEDYLACLRKVHPHADYVTVNISSPNTANLRALQAGDALDALLAALMAERDALDARAGRHVPLAVKLAPDLDEAGIDAAADACLRHRVEAVIATNTTLSRQGVEGMPHADEGGGLSGAPLRPRATAVLRRLHAALRGQVTLVGVGGILSGEDAREKRDAGAALVQVYTGLVYRGPALVREAVRALDEP